MKLMCLGLSPLNWLVISGLVPTGFPPNISPYWRTARWTFCRAVSGPTCVSGVGSGMSSPASAAGPFGGAWIGGEMVAAEFEPAPEAATETGTDELFVRLV